MKFKLLFSLCLAGAALGAYAQTHTEGVEYYKAGQLENAKELLERNLNNSGTDKALAYYYLGQVAQDYQKLADAQKAYEAGIAANPENPYNYVGMAGLSLLNGQVKEAEQLIKQAQKLTKKDPELEIAIARAYYNADPVAYTKQIEKAIEKARKYNMQDASIYLFEGDRFRDQGGDNATIGKAANMYEMATNYDPQEAAAYVKYANLFKKLNPQYSVQMLQKLLQNNPNSALGQRELALTYYNMDNFKDAAAQYGKYVQNPNHFKQDENEYAFLLFYNNEYQKGYDYASKLLQENPQDFTAQRFQYMNAAQLGDQFGNEKLLALAENLYKNHKANPEKNKLAQIDYTLLIQEFQGAKDYPNAEAVALEAVKEYPNAPHFNMYLARIYGAEKNYPAAATAIDEYMAKTEKPSFSDSYFATIYNTNAGITLMDTDAAKAQSHIAAAKKYAQEAVDRNKCVATLKLAGDTNRPTSAAETTNHAIPFYEEAIALYEANPQPADAEDAHDIYLMLASYYKDSDAAKAADYVNKAEALKQ